MTKQQLIELETGIRILYTDMRSKDELTPELKELFHSMMNVITEKIKKP